jgi:hypothetical protein
MRMLPLLIAFTLLAAGISYALATEPLHVRGPFVTVQFPPSHAP